MLNRGSYRIRLARARHVLTVLENHPEVAEMFGIDGPESGLLVRGRALYERAQEAYYHRSEMVGEALAAVDRCRAAFDAARIAGGRLTALARVMITTPSDRDRLGIAGRRAEAMSAWRMQAEVFHANLTDVDRSLLAGVGVDGVTLARAKALLTDLAEAHADCVAAKAEAKATTEAKRLAFGELAAFMSVLIGVARVLEADAPEIMGLLKMSPDGRRRRAPASSTSASALTGLSVDLGGDEALRMRSSAAGMEEYDDALVRMTVGRGASSGEPVSVVSAQPARRLARKGRSRPKRGNRRRCGRAGAR